MLAKQLQEAKVQAEKQAQEAKAQAAALKKTESQLGETTKNLTETGKQLAGVQAELDLLLAVHAEVCAFVAIHLPWYLPSGLVPCRTQLDCSSVFCLLRAQIGSTMLP